MVIEERAQETPPLEPETGFVPEPMTTAETGLDIGPLADLALKALYYEGQTTAGQLGSLLALSQPVMQEVMEFLNRGKLCEVLGSEGHGPTSYRYRLTGSGVARAAAAFERNMYVGPAPVPIADYVNQVRQQSISHVRFDPPAVEEALAKLVLSPETRKRIGKAVASRRSTLIYGATGNGKSTVARRLGEALSGCVLIPHAIDVYGHIVRLFDPSKHQPAPDADRPSPAPRRRDRRWRPAARPAVLAGGELTHYSLELVFNDQSKVYEAPLQMKANGGILIIDDLGRQQMSAVALLNRWIVALEGGVDHLTLHTGQTIEVPFDVIPIFSTNLNPEDLADEAFLRRIRYKVEIPNPTEEEFRAIFDRVGREYGLCIEGRVVDHLLTRWYRPVGRELRGCHPRDLIEAVVDAAGYEGSRAAFTHETLDEACRTYFLGPIDEKSGRQAGRP